MRIASVIARYLLGLIFLVFWFEMASYTSYRCPPPKGAAGGSVLVAAIFASHYWVVIFSIQVMGGILLLINRYVVARTNGALDQWS